MDVKDTYNSVLETSDGLFRDKGSRFISRVFPVENEAEVKSIVDSLRKEFHDARHVCYAYRLGLDGSRWRANDDGEPSGTAGRQILGQIDSFGLSDVLVVVIRYFGGILLGVPGLIRAYRTSAADALSRAAVVEKVAGEDWRLEFPYEALPGVMSALKEMSIVPLSRDFGEKCTLSVRVRLSRLDIFLEKMKKMGIFINNLETVN